MLTVSIQARAFTLTSERELEPDPLELACAPDVSTERGVFATVRMKG
jgi:hypothetical protein